MGVGEGGGEEKEGRHRESRKVCARPGLGIRVCFSQFLSPVGWDSLELETSEKPVGCAVSLPPVCLKTVAPQHCPFNRVG